MTKVVFPIIGIWILVIFAIILISASSSASDEITSEASAAIAASIDGNTDIIGVQEAVDAFPAYKWAIPPVVGIVLTGIVLFKNRDELSNR